jgi:prophage regulatory protein
LGWSLTLQSAYADGSSVKERDMTQLLDLRGTCAVTTLSKSIIYELIRAGKFPKPIRIPHTRRVAWRVADVDAAIAAWAEQSK